MKKLLIGLIVLSFMVDAAIADSSFVAPSSVGTAVPGQVPGTSTNDSAAAGKVNEVILSNIGSGSSVSLTTNTATNVTSISLTAGDWIVYGIISYNGGSTTLVTSFLSGISQVSATLPSSSLLNFWAFPSTGQAVFLNNPSSFNLFPSRVSISSTTTVYLVANCIFTVSTCTAFGSIEAHRAR